MFEVFFLGFFFTIWNYLIGRFVVMTISRLFREGCGNYMCILLWPHWIFGLLFPLLIGISSYGQTAGMLLLIASGVLPYLYWAVQMNCRNVPENEYIRNVPCFSCLRKDVYKNRLEKSIICRRVVEGNPANNHSHETIVHVNLNANTNANVDANVDATNCESDKSLNSNSNGSSKHRSKLGRGRLVSDSDTLSFRSKHPKSDIIKRTKKVVSISSNATKLDDANNNVNNNMNNNIVKNGNDEGCGCGNSNGNGNNDNENSNDQNDQNDEEAALNNNNNNHVTPLFPISIPDDDDNENENENDNDQHKNGNDEELGSCAKSIGTSYSVQLCSICLDEYKVGDEIAYSKNDECYHAFHKDCIIEWLLKHGDSCPICRNKF